jgi:hypothetical protein
MRARWLPAAFLAGAMVLVLSCASAPAPAPAPGPAPTETPTPSVQEQPAEPGPEEPFVATEELKKRTFDEVQAVIDDLEAIIASSDYDRWLGYLTADYIASRSSEDFLRSASEAGVLKKAGIELKSLRDYFVNVVVRSHFQATLADITFVDADRVKAYTRVQGTLYILYYLVHEDGRWKIGVQPSGDT